MRMNESLKLARFWSSILNLIVYLKTRGTKGEVKQGLMKIDVQRIQRKRKNVSEALKYGGGEI